MSERAARTGAAALELLCACLVAACSAPISTLRSPAHPRIVEIRNDTDETRMLEIEPAAGQHLGASTTFTGRLKPGEVKVLHVYDGFTYRVRLVDATGRGGEVRREVAVRSDLELAYAGDSLREAANPEVVVGRPTLVSSETYEGYAEAQLDSVFAQLDVFLTARARSAYHSLDAERKRELLVQFWARRDPTPDTPENEFRREVETRLSTIERDFRSPAQDAASTPRGRIYLRYGRPDRRVIRTLETGFAAPYEVWTYYSTGYTYVFLDEFRNGRYILLTSTDPQEQGRPDWQQRLPRETVEEILRD